MTRVRGTTLVEMLVTLTLLGIVASVATLALRVVERPAPEDLRAVVHDSASASIHEGRAITIVHTTGARRVYATVWPDGSVAADTDFGTDPLGGRGLHAR
jgi:prepilin-type N-terminal cleavage/methylation domain-containing protein